MSRGGVLMIACLLAMLLAAGVGGIMAWNAVGGGGPEQEISLHGFIALGLGIVGSLVVGGGLMALVFFSSRSGHDRAVHEDGTRRMPPDEAPH